VCSSDTAASVLDVRAAAWVDRPRLLSCLTTVQCVVTACVSVCLSVCLSACLSLPVCSACDTVTTDNDVVTENDRD